MVCLPAKIFESIGVRIAMDYSVIQIKLLVYYRRFDSTSINRIISRLYHQKPCFKFLYPPKMLV
jgi:hypothetical protein